jgi:hypothetical protein
LPPDLGLINIITGLTFSVGIGLITNNLSSLSGCERQTKIHQNNNNTNREHLL